jgi:hypothetical protein
VACNSDQLGAQGRVNALCEGGAYGAAAALAGGEADAYVVVDGEAHATGDEATIAVRPCPSVTLLEDHNSGVFVSSARRQYAREPNSESRYSQAPCVT